MLYHTKLLAEELLLLPLAKLSPDQVSDDHIIQQSEVLLALQKFTNTQTPLISKIFPLIYYNLQNIGFLEQVPEETALAAKQLYHSMIAANLVKQSHLQQLLQLFTQSNIQVILLKGVAFANFLYPSQTPRTGLDIDLLIKEDDFHKACNLLYKTHDPVVLSEKRLFTHKVLFEKVFKPKDNISPYVELHKGLTNPYIFKIDQQNLWGGSTEHPFFNNRNIRLLSTEHTLLHLAVHGFRDIDFCSHNILDAHEIWCQWRPDVEKLFMLAEQWGARKVLYYLLGNCKLVLDTPVPTNLLERLKPGRINNRLNSRILSSEIVRENTSNSKEYRLTQLLSQLTFPDNISQGIKYQASYGWTRLLDIIAAMMKRGNFKI